MVPGIDEVVVLKKGTGVFSGLGEKGVAAPFRRGDSAPEFVSCGVDGVAGQSARTLGLSDRLAAAAADARDRSAGGRASGRVLPAPRQGARFPRRRPLFPGQPHIVVSEELRAIGVQRAERRRMGRPRPLVALAPGAAYGGAKRWPPASFAELARALADDGIQSVMVGGRADLPVAREIEAALGGDVVLNLMGTDLPTLAGILRACRALVSNDSGAMHLGAGARRSRHGGLWTDRRTPDAAGRRRRTSC